MKKLITILLLILFFFTSNVSYSRKTRSDKGGHHKHKSEMFSSESKSSSSTTASSTDYKSDSTIKPDWESKWRNRGLPIFLAILSIPVIYSIYRISKRTETLNTSSVFLLFIFLLPVGIFALWKNYSIDSSSKREQREWASDDGKKFYEKLLKMIRNNESIKMSDIEDLKDLSNITKSSVNEKFQVKDGKFDSRIWFLILMLNDRYNAENKILNGLTESESLEKYSINLNKDEVLYEVFEDCSWYELKRNKQASFYHGLGLRIPLGGGFSYKVGSISSLNPQYSEDYKKISDGKLFLTSKRIIFLGSSENKSVNINSLLDIDVYYDSIVLGKSTGKKPLIKFYLDDAAVFSRILSRIF